MKSTTKLGLHILALLFIAITAFAVTVTTLPVVTQSIKQTPSIKFLEMCSSIKITTQNSLLMAESNCLGRISGYVAGHEMTMELTKLYSPTSMPKLWCVPSNVVDGQLLQSVLKWISLNEGEFQTIRSKYKDSDASMLIISKALANTYICSK